MQRELHGPRGEGLWTLRRSARDYRSEVIYVVAASALLLGLVTGFLIGARYASGRHHLRSPFLIRPR